MPVEEPTPGMDTVMRVALDSRLFFQRLLDNPREAIEELRAITPNDVDRMVAVVEAGRMRRADLMQLWDEKHMMPSWDPGSWPMRPPPPWAHGGSGPVPPHP